MGIIRSGAKNKDKGTKDNLILDDVPFVPAMDLLDAESSRVSDEEICAIAVALYLALPRIEDFKSTWALNARIEGVSQRI